MTDALIDEHGWLMLAPPTRGRSCGKCQACCTIIPVELPDGQKQAGQRCQHQCSKGCAIYEHRPLPCRMWSCRWLFDPDAIEIRRPDHSGYIVDSVRDTLLINGEPFDCMQVWIDPNHREAHRDPKLRDYIAYVAARYSMPTIVRFSQKDAIVLFPPAISPDGAWHERGGESIDQEAMNEKLAEIGQHRRFL